MPLFGKTFGNYLRFSKGVLIVTVAVGLARLLLSLAGADNIANWFSLTALAPLVLIYFGVTVHTSGFGSYKQLLVVVFIQGVVNQAVTALGIAITPLTGIETIFAAAGMPAVSNHWAHAASHLIGAPIFALVQWIPAAIVLAVTKLAVKRPAAP